MDKLERMDEFFASRTEGYDEHMLEEVEGCKEGYAEMARLVPQNIKNLLDLGCGTGLELDRIFEIYSDIFVTGIDLTASMLEKLRQKHPDKSLELICGDYFTVGFKNNFYDCAVSFQTMHHFSHDKKITLYKKIYDSLTADGIYIECDYMAETQEQEDFFFAENERLRREQGIGADEFYHYDTPCTFENQIKLLEKAGFLSVKHVFRLGATSIIVAKKNIMKTIKIFDAKNYPLDLPVFQRSAVRAVIVRKNKILLVKSEKEGFYKFPGGGMEEGETFADTLIRETLEEVGYPIVPSSIKEFGLIEEKLLSTVNVNQIFHQLSYYFTADVLDERCEQSLDNYEKELGFNPEWVDIETAIRINSEFDEKYGVSFVRRDTFVLKYIWENKNV